MSAAELAESLSLSEPTMARFARRLGFASFSGIHVMLQVKFLKPGQSFYPHSQPVELLACG